MTILDNHSRLLSKVALVMLLLFSHFALAQQPVWLNYTSADGLPSNEVYQVHQDKLGYIWFCTDGGVSVFDGKDFRNFSSENGLPDNTVLGMYEGLHDKLWFRTLSGRIFNINMRTYKIETIEALIPEYLMTTLYVDDQENVYTGVTSSHVIFKISPPHRNENISTIDDSTAKLSIHMYGNDGMTYGRCVNAKNDFTVIYQNGSKCIAEIPDPLTCRKVIRMGAYLLACTQNTNHLIGPEGVLSFTSDDLVNNAYIDNGGNLVMCLGGNSGVHIFNQMDMASEPKKYFEGIGISSMIQDTEGNYWFSSMTNGVLFVPTFSLLLYTSEQHYTNNKSTGVYCIDSERVLGKYYDNTFYYPRNIDLNKNEVKDVITFECSDEIKVHSAHGVQIQKAQYIEKYAASEVFRMKGSEGYWAVQPRAVTHCDEHYKIISRFVPDTRINGFDVQGDSIIWLACLNGLWSFSDEKLQMHLSENPLLAMRFDDVTSAADGSLWLCSRSGGVVHKQFQSISNYTIKNGLISNICRTILEDNGTIWVGTNRGISTWRHVNGEVPNIKNISLDNGLPSAEISMLTKCGNNIWAASDAGIFSFDSRHSFENRHAPLVYVNRMMVNGQLHEHLKPLEFSHHQNFIQFSLVGLSFKYPKANAFKYRLEGLDTSWVITTNSEVSFTTLPSGKYRFVAYALNNSGMSSSEPVVVNFTILKAFWWQWWFIAFVLLVICSLVYFLLQKRIASVRTKADEKTNLAKSIAELEMRALRTQMNPHFIFNCINSIQHFILSNDKMEAQRQLSRFSKLIRNVLENSKQEQVPIQVEIETLELYIQMEALRFDSKFSYTLTVDETIDKVSTMLPPMLIQPFVENAIGHGLLPLKERAGHLLVALDKVNGYLRIIVDDNGIGRTEATQLKQRKASGRKSLGISITKERLDLLSKVSNNIMLNIEDKTDINGYAVGTRVTLALPIQKV